MKTATKFFLIVCVNLLAIACSEDDEQPAFNTKVVGNWTVDWIYHQFYKGTEKTDVVNVFYNKAPLILNEDGTASFSYNGQTTVGTYTAFGDEFEFTGGMKGLFQTDKYKISFDNDGNLLLVGTYVPNSTENDKAEVTIKAEK